MLTAGFFVSRAALFNAPAREEWTYFEGVFSSVIFSLAIGYVSLNCLIHPYFIGGKIALIPS